MRILFLDIDGVLNGYNKWTYRIIKISKVLHIPSNVMRKRLRIFEVKEKYVRRLSKIIKNTGAKIVMSSSWRGGYWKTPYEEMYTDQKILHDLLHKYNLEIIDITPSGKKGIREDEINQWLTDTDLIVDRFVILDDESSDLQSFVGKELVKTSNVLEGAMIKGLPYEDTGLKRKHVRQAIMVLNDNSDEYMKEINSEHNSLEEKDLPKCCKECTKKFYLLLGFSCSCERLRKTKINGQ